jgi:hypothetical protein
MDVRVVTQPSLGPQASSLNISSKSPLVPKKNASLEDWAMDRT